MVVPSFGLYDFLRKAQLLHDSNIHIVVSSVFIAIFIPLCSFFATRKCGKTKLTISGIGFIFIFFLSRIFAVFGTQSAFSVGQGLTLSLKSSIVIWSDKFGPVAQLGERSVRIREVKGSNPSRSTTKTACRKQAVFCLCKVFMQLRKGVIHGNRRHSGHSEIPCGVFRRN